MHIFVPIVVSAIILGLSGDKKLLKIMLGFVILICIIVTFLMVSRNDNLFKRLPFTSIDSANEIEVGKDGVMFLESSYSAILTNEYFLSGDLDIDSLQSWVSRTQKAIYIHIKNQDDLVWGCNLGIADANIVSTIESIYNKWKTDGVVPNEKVRYKFMWFYFEV